MTDIEQQIAQASTTGKSTAILQDAEHVTEPLQIYPFVAAFFRAYSPENRAAFEDAYSSSKYAFAKMLIGFTDPPSFSAIMNNGDYFVHWDQSRARLATWFAMLSEDLDADAATKSLLSSVKDSLEKVLSTLSSLPNASAEEIQRAKTNSSHANEVAIAYIITSMFDALDRQYRSFQRQLIDAENRDLSRVAWLSNATRDANMNWVNSMDAFVRMRQAGGTNAAPTATLASAASAAANAVSRTILDAVAHFAKHVLAASPLAVSARLPIGVEVDATAPTARIVSVVNPNARSAAAAGGTTTRAAARSAAAATPAAARAATPAAEAAPEESIAEHYRRIIADFGAHMLELFRSFGFPPVFALDAMPSFTVEWDGYITLGYNSFKQLAAERFAYLQQRGKAAGRAPPNWSLDRIYGDDQAAALFAEFVGYKKGVPALTVAPGQYVQRTNATYHYAINNMSLRFVSLYDHMVSVDTGARKRARNWP